MLVAVWKAWDVAGMEDGAPNSLMKRWKELFEFWIFQDCKHISEEALASCNIDQYIGVHFGEKDLSDHKLT